MRTAIAVVLPALLVVVTHLGSIVLTVPMVTDAQLAEYAAAAAELQVDVSWQTLVALDAVRYRQDFSRATPAAIRQTAALFVACRSEGNVETMEWTFAFDGDAIRYPLVVAVPSRVAWRVEVQAGQVWTELQNSLDQAVLEDVVEPGSYTVLVYAVAAPAAVTLTVQVQERAQVCYGRPIDEVMDDLGFAAADREMAKAILAGLREGT